MKGLFRKLGRIHAYLFGEYKDYPVTHKQFISDMYYYEFGYMEDMEKLCKPIRDKIVEDKK